MNTNTDLGDWGETMAAPDEEPMAAFLDTLLGKFERGEEVTDATWSRTTPAVAEEGRRLLDDLTWFYPSVVSLWEHMGLLENRSTPAAPAAIMEGTFPDPFPGEFRIRRFLGQGTFGEVWLADDLNVGNRPVALKTVRLSGRPGAAVRSLSALRNEADLLGQLRHPNIVQVYAWRQTAGPADPEHYLVLQYVAGGSLDKRLEEDGPLLWHQAARYVADVGDGLLEVHARGIVHRDIKPANILWDPARDEALLTDFGIGAYLLHAVGVAGAPLYMAPEAFDGRSSPAMDVYSLAASLFQLVTAEPPFQAETLEELYQKIRVGLPALDPRCASLPEPLERIIRSGLAAEPERRPALGEFVTRLRASLNQLLADTLPPPVPSAQTQAAVDLRLIVSKQVGRDTYQAVATTHPQPSVLTRDIKKVPRPPEQVRLRTGDRIRIELTASQDGYATVFNIGPTGNLNLLYPEQPAPAPPILQARQPLHVLELELTPPVGRERLVAVWSRTPLPVRPEELLSLAGAEQRAYYASRDILRVKKSVQQLRPEEKQVVVLELEHEI